MIQRASESYPCLGEWEEERERLINGSGERNVCEPSRKIERKRRTEVKSDEEWEVLKKD